MSKENKGREFWIEDNWSTFGSSIAHNNAAQVLRRRQPTIHVIEYKDFEKCQAENEGLKKQLAVVVGALKDVVKYPWGIGLDSEKTPSELAIAALNQIEEIKNVLP